MSSNAVLLEDLRELDFADAEKLYGGMLLDSGRLEQFIRGGRINTDDHPIIEFEMPKHLYEPTTVGYLEALRQCC